ncbi:hypothetical protein H6F43_06935 [Leptolyngbya sp. FACHB-36]|uniref:hypothetical protein n=1 Tax=Leptolyngbya sp. FACHB-36 TaxID=2692808 RepID=UPI0016800523|nr:hypothetical protein [Leptolyngbya sp. FACHB-36]MBD2019921.1 hypothetical protein [Leptolyngbya sp. FACHB-36]
MTVSRIVLDDEIRAAVDAIQQKTKTTSPSAAIALMVSRYARHLLETWELTAARYPEPNPATYYGPASDAQVPPSEFEFTEQVSL